MPDTLFVVKELVVILVSYLLGCLATGYYLVRWRTGQDLRRMGSGSTGGTNAGRALGRPALLLTMLADMAKGMLAVWAARYFRLDEWAVALTAAAVVAGHVFPIQLRFQGGRGLSPALGAMLVYDAPLVLGVVGVTGLLWLLTRRLTLSLMAGVAAAPLLALVLGRPVVEVLGLIPMAVIIATAHRQKLAEDIAALRGRAHP